MMSQSNTQQTRIDQYYKIISNKNTGCGIKLSTQKYQQTYCRKTKLKKSSKRMSTLVESEVKIIKEISPSKKVDNTVLTFKKVSPLVLEELSRKRKHDSHENTNENIQNDTLIKKYNQNENNFSEKKSSFTPKTPTTPQRNNKTLSQTNTFSPRKLFFTDRINMDVVREAVENLNLIRQGRISINELDLEAIYQSKEFNIVYSNYVNQNAEKFELKDVILPHEKHADHLLMIVMDVFSNPLNCGYFLKQELDMIFSLFTLSAESQMLFVRLLKRKLGWHRTSSIKYPEIANDLNPFFKELIQNKFCSSDLDSVDISVILNMLQVEEVRNICQKLKIDHRRNKSILVNKLLKYGNSSKTFFLGAKSPKSVLRSMALLILETCVCLPENIINLFDKVLILLHPVQDPSESIADFFLVLTNVHKGEILYPPVLKRDNFPIFQNRSHLINYVKSKNVLKEILACIEKKEWDRVRQLGRDALKHLSNSVRQVNTSLPVHVQKFAPEYLWIKCLSKSIDAFKKTPETINEAVDILQTLINEKVFSHNSRGQWYNELALIEMFHRKDLESSAALTLHALNETTLTEVDVSDLTERLRKLMRRKTGISKETKILIQKAQEEIESRGLATQSISTKTVTANMADRIEAGGKSTWFINLNGNNKYYGSVEMLALQHYISEENFHEGLHCEGSLPITLFTAFFWDELYNFSVPGAFVSPYQDVPLDLFTTEFFNNRKERIEEKIKFVRALDLESFIEWIHGKYSNCLQYKCVISNQLFKNDECFKQVVTCLGINGVTGICERLVTDFRLWKSGFPDLILWNILIQKCKIVEVKGPGDSLSEKQKLWLQYLERLGIEVEVCHVEALGRSSK